MERISTSNKGGMVESPTYVCSTTEFTRDTDLQDGCYLYVANETTYQTERYCYSFNGHWIDC